MKKKITFFMICIVLLILVSGSFLFFKNNSSLKLEISSVKIHDDEYINAMNSKKYDVTQYFIEKYGAKITNEFWEKDFNGEYPYKVLADKTLEELLRIHSIYEIAKEEGYVDSVEYKDFIIRFDDENKKREESRKKGETIYGLSKFTEALFLEYETDKLQKSYCNDLNNEGMKISSDDGRRYYDENKDTLFIKNDDFELSFVKVYYESLGLNEEEVKDIKSHMVEVSKKVDDINSLLYLASKDEKLKDYLSHETILSAELSAKAKVMGDVLDIAIELEKGEITQVLDQNGCLYLIQCINRVSYDYIPYEEVKDNINKVLRENLYDEIVEERARNLAISNDIDNIYKFTKKNIK
ncbi:peptidyl-prolyl cis-trans isomerase [Clostridium sartagoforme]|jgi:PPIC-type PPIASE domain|uniref:peptidyl-prolyl cis-trans isomerase n=1 Tax=Clostridium sartagoforme TaxID=84031 RepID=UPI0031DC48A1